MKQLIINPEYGMAGDMFSAALISAGAPEKDLIDVMISAASPLGQCEITALKEQRGDTAGIFLRISLEENLHGIKVKTAYEHLVKTCEQKGIKREYKEFSLKALTILGDAEQKAHAGESMENLHLHSPHLHEAQDIIIDLAGAAYGMQELGISLSSVTCLSPVCMGGGKIKFSHGTLDVPAPATTHIISDFAIPVKHGPVERELFTPTGAAILAALNPEFIERDTYKQNYPGQKVKQGIGFGTMRIKMEKKGPNGLYIFLKENVE